MPVFVAPFSSTTADTVDAARSRVCAITLDLDDTLWENVSVIERAEEAVQGVLWREYPVVARRYGVGEIRAWRERLAREHADIHDVGDLRALTYRTLFEACGLPGREAEALLGVFMDVRNDVTLFEDVMPVLEPLSAVMPIVSLSNGNADIDRIGISHLFHDCISTREAGAAKPDIRIFLMAQQRLGLEPRQILHIGDSPLTDVYGAHNAGFQSAWVNRTNARWSHSFHPDYTLVSMHDLHPILDSDIAALREASSQQR